MPPGSSRERRPDPPDPSGKEDGGVAPAVRKAHDPLVGRSLAGYTILARTRVGKLCVTYKAERAAMQRNVSLKILRSDAASDPTTLRRFYNTAKVAARFHHPNIANMYNVASAGKLHFCSMEHIDGTSLDEVLRGRDRMASSDAVRVAIDVAEALLFASGKKLPGFFLTSERIVFSNRGEVKLLPPDAVPSNAPPPSEAYVLRATGVLLYAILTGGKLHNVDKLLSPSVTAISGIQPIRTVTRSVQQGLAHVVDALLGLPSRHSFSRVEPAIGELRRLLQVQERTESRTHSASMRAAQRHQRSKMKLFAAIGIVAVALIAVIALLVRQSGEKADVRREFEQAKLVSDSELQKYGGARKVFAEAPTTEQSERVLQHLLGAKNAFANVLAEYPEGTLASTARENIAKIDGAIRDFKKYAQTKVYDIAARDDLAKLRGELAAMVESQKTKGQKIDVAAWHKKYKALDEKHPLSPAGQAKIRESWQSAYRKMLLAQFEIDTRILEGQTVIALLRQYRFGAAIEAWDKYRETHRKQKLLQFDVLRKHGRATSQIRGTAHRLCGVLLHYAERDAQKGRKDKAREVLQGIIDNFGIDEEVERARRALKKVEEG
ncbi:protein kinase [bacterium]|nr:protein kinase [bacterium]